MTSALVLPVASTDPEAAASEPRRLLLLAAGFSGQVRVFDAMGV